VEIARKRSAGRSSLSSRSCYKKNQPSSCLRRQQIRTVIPFSKRVTACMAKAKVPTASSLFLSRLDGPFASYVQNRSLTAAQSTGTGGLKRAVSASWELADVQWGRSKRSTFLCNVLERYNSRCCWLPCKVVRWNDRLIKEGCVLMGLTESP
jgi:hypothetical protein